MSTDLSSPSSNTSNDPVILPWETLGHIFSFCDRPTLVALSLVSFGCWELAGPILYQNVEIVHLDGLASLFFVDVVPSSLRLQQAPSLLSRIRVLVVDIRSQDQKREPIFDLPSVNEEEEEDFGGCSLLLPHRLLAFTSSPLLIRSLILPFGHNDHSSASWLFNSSPTFLPSRSSISPSPTSATLGSTPRCTRLRTSSLARWTDLERVTWVGCCLTIIPPSPDAYREDPLYSFWRPPLEENGKRPLEMVFTWDATFGEEALGFRLKVGGVSQELASAVDLRVVLTVRKEEEKVAKEEVEKLDEWSKKLVRVSTQLVRVKLV